MLSGAIEKQKLVYILNRDSQARLTISSPLEAHKGNTLVYHMVGIDVGFENPMFACLELDYEEADNDPSGEAVQTTQQVRVTWNEVASIAKRLGQTLLDRSINLELLKNIPKQIKNTQERLMCGGSILSC